MSSGMIDEVGLPAKWLRDHGLRVPERIPNNVRIAVGTHITKDGKRTTRASAMFEVSADGEPSRTMMLVLLGPAKR